MITFTKSAQQQIKDKLDSCPAGTRARIAVYGIGCQCKPQHPEGSITFSQNYDSDDEIFEIDGIPCVMSREEYAGGNVHLRIGAAGIRF